MTAKNHMSHCVCNSKSMTARTRCVCVWGDIQLILAGGSVGAVSRFFLFHFALLFYISEGKHSFHCFADFDTNVTKSFSPGTWQLYLAPEADLLCQVSVQTVGVGDVTDQMAVFSPLGRAQNKITTTCQINTHVTVFLSLWEPVWNSVLLAEYLVWSLLH